MSRVDDDQDRQKLDQQRNDMIFTDPLPQNEAGEHRDKNRVAGKNNGNHGGFGIVDCHLIERHGDAHKQASEQGKEAGVLRMERRFVRAHGADGERQQHQTADQKPQSGDLQRVEHSAYHLQHDLDQTEDQGTQKNIKIAGTGLFHGKKRSLSLWKQWQYMTDWEKMQVCVDKTQKTDIINAKYSKTQ